MNPSLSQSIVAILVFRIHGLVIGGNAVSIAYGVGVLCYWFRDRRDFARWQQVWTVLVAVSLLMTLTGAPHSAALTIGGGLAGVFTLIRTNR